MNTIVKECKYHGLTEFSILNNGETRCKKCSSETVANKRERNKRILVEYKGGKCQRCGYDKCLDALEFHHINPDEKEFGIGRVTTHSLESLKREADKCILLCANCHRELHYELKKEKIQHERKSIDSAVIDEIKKLSETMTMVEIARELSMPKNSVVNIFNRYNIRKLKHDNPLDDYSIELFCEQYKEVKSLLQVGKLNGVSDNAIRKWLKRNNYPTDKEGIKKFIEKS